MWNYKNNPFTTISQISQKLDHILSTLNVLTQQENKTLSALTDLQDEVVAVAAAENGAIAAIQALVAKLATVPADDTAAITAVHDQLKTTTDALAAAVAAVTPAPAPVANTGP